MVTVAVRTGISSSVHTRCSSCSEKGSASIGVFTVASSPYPTLCAGQVGGALAGLAENLLNKIKRKKWFTFTV
jgi:hypothetical protein